MTKIRLQNISTDAPAGAKKDEMRAATTELAKEIGDYQHLLYAEGKKSMLIVFQGMDSSGKDGVTQKIFRYCSPSGITAHAFKKPTEEEFAHDFLWRIHERTPAKGQIVVFNRSHYEDILIQRVHRWIDDDHVRMRMDAINAFERLLVEDNNTTILKFYMHISKERQKEKLQERIDLPRKNWKHNEGDWEERKHWDRYMQCYEDVINKCKYVPWIVAPVDQRWYRDYFIADKIRECMRNMNFVLPTLPKSSLSE